MKNYKINFNCVGMDGTGKEHKFTVTREFSAGNNYYAKRKVPQVQKTFIEEMKNDQGYAIYGLLVPGKNAPIDICLTGIIAKELLRLEEKVEFP